MQKTRAELTEQQAGKDSLHSEMECRLEQIELENEDLEEQLESWQVCWRMNHDT